MQPPSILTSDWLATQEAAEDPELRVEQHYKVPTIAKRYGLSQAKVRELFYDEPGVIKLGADSRLTGGRVKKLKRHYHTLLIPESVVLRVMDRSMNKRPASPVGGNGRLRSDAS